MSPPPKETKPATPAKKPPIASAASGTGSSSGPPRTGGSAQLPTHGGSGSSGRSSADPVLVGNLRLFCDNKWGLEVSYEGPELSDCSAIPKGDPRFKLLAYCIHLGLKFLEHGVGNAALVATASQIITERRMFKRAQDAKIHAKGQNTYDSGNTERPLTEMKGWVDTFLKKVRADFPTTYATRTLPPFADGMTHNSAWGTDMREYQPKLGGMLYIHQCVSSKNRKFPPILVIPT